MEYALQDYKQEKLDYLKTRPCIAQWISGAKAYYADIIDIKKYPNGVIQTLQRPLVSLSILNYDKDIEFENKIQKEREEKKFIMVFFNYCLHLGNAINQNNQAIKQHISNNPSLYLEI